MDGIGELDIHLNSAGEVFIAGDEISGHVIVNLRRPLDIYNVKIELIGKAYCYWSEGEADNYIGKENIIRETTCLCGSTTTLHTFTFPINEQTYPFSFNLSERLPSSFKGEFGYIRYFLKAVIRRPWKNNLKTKLPVKIYDKIDANLPMYREGQGGETHEKVGLLCYKTATVDMDASIDRSCYCPGESIRITSSITNTTGKDMPFMYAKLMQTVSYMASGKTKTSTKVVARLKGPNIPTGRCEAWENEPFCVPGISSTIRCQVISVQYQMLIKVRVRCATDPAIPINVVIGTIPLEHTNEPSRVECEHTVAPPNYHDIVENDETSLLPETLSINNSEESPPRYSTVCLHLS